MSAGTAFERGGSLKILMDEVVAVAHGVADAIPAAKTASLVPDELPSLSVYRWRPTQFDAPGIYHWIAPSPFRQEDMMRWRDTINVLVRVGVAYGTEGSEMDFLEPYCDLYRQQVDPLIGANANSGTQPFNGAAHWAERTDMRSVNDEFNGIPYLCMEFVIQARLDRRIAT